MKRHRFIPAAIIVAAIVVAGLILAQEREALVQAREGARMAHRLQLRSCAEHVHDYFDAVYALLLFVSVDEDVVALRQTSRPYIEKLFEHGLEQDQLTEVYVVERGFEGIRRPFMTFERGSEGMEATEVHAAAREQDEYQIQKQQLQAFELNPAIRALLSPETHLCAPSTTGTQALGHVYSVPIRSGSNFVGLVAGMLRTDTILDALRHARGDYVAALVNEHGAVILDAAAPVEIRQWLTSAAGLKHLAAGTESVHETRELPNWVMLSTRAHLESGDRWWLAYFYEQAQEGESDAFLGAAGHVALAASILIAAFALAFLVRTLTRRVAEQAQHLQQRKELERQVQEASDRERRRAGNAMREDICQRLTGIDAVVKVLHKKMTSAHLPEAEVASELSTDVKETLNIALEMADELQPVSVLKHGFVAAMGKVADNLRNRKGIPCDVDLDHFPEDLDPAVGTDLYRIAQEALNNIVQHADATRVTIKLASAGERVTMQVADNGRGFEMLNAHKEGMGLRIMRYRSELIGADLTIASTPGKGTVVTCSCSAEGPGSTKT